ncbi:PhnA domain-containing protein [Chitinophaga deserti]|uniref:PhnA domain-containing protein n=1 Tax=Chitinophaga deserti TaxID=2164099 RepID=UPI000D6CF49C|nr:alkylphosphonate utilization protein [Chitinophaga deserti]
MKLPDDLKTRSNSSCELCTSTEDLAAYEVPHAPEAMRNTAIATCGKCRAQLERKEPLDAQHWQCLTTAMWSEVPAVQVVAWRMLNRLRNETWAAEQLDMMYLDDELLAWAKASGDHDNDDVVELHLDSNGTQLQHGDTVVLTKSLDVKGTSLNAKMGTVVKNIRLVENNTEQIEGKIEGQLIVILTKYVRKQNA